MNDVVAGGSFLNMGIRKIINYLKKAWKYFARFLPFRFQIVLGLLLLLSILVITAFFWGKSPVGEFAKELKDNAAPLSLRNVAIAFAALGTAIFTWWKNSLSERNTALQQKSTAAQQRTADVQENNRLDSLFAQAVQYLNPENDLLTRKGGVYILKDLACTSPKHAQKCLDMLCSLNETWMPKFLNDIPEFFSLNLDFTKIINLDELRCGWERVDGEISYLHLSKTPFARYKKDIAISQVALITISNLISEIVHDNSRLSKLDLSYKFLCGGNFTNCDFSRYILNNANFNSAKLSNCNFHATNLFKANLQNADISKSDLSCANMDDCNLNNIYAYDSIFFRAMIRGASLEAGNFQNANLEYSNLKDSKITKAVFKSANLNFAYLWGCACLYTNFEDAKLYRTDFRNTDAHRLSIFNENQSNAIFTSEDLKGIIRSENEYENCSL